VQALAFTREQHLVEPLGVRLDERAVDAAGEEAIVGVEDGARRVAGATSMMRRGFASRIMPCSVIPSE
jgi:hypothetical protein